MMRLPNFINKSVSTRTTVLVLCVITVLMLIAGFMQVNYSKKVVAEDTRRQAGRSMDNAIKIIDDRVSRVETAVNTAAAYADRFAPQELYADTLLERLITANEDIAAATLLYRADFFPKHGRYYAPTISRNLTTGTLDVDEIGGEENDFCYLETDSNWIYSNLLDDGYWCLPYIDSMSTKRAMVSYSVPLHDAKGNTYAVLCADMDLQWVQNIVDSAKPYEHSQVYILGRDSQYVCHPDQRFIKSVNAIKEMEKSQHQDHMRIFRRMLRGERGIDTVSGLSLTPNAKRPSTDIVFYAPVDRLQWSICFTIPEEKIMEEPNRLRNHLIVFLIIMLMVISVVLHYVIYIQLRPLKTLADSTVQVAQGDFHAALPHIMTQDEIRNLRDSFENMQLSLAQYIEELQKTTASKAMIESELHVATNIQMSMLPKEADFKLSPRAKELPPIDIYGKLTPAKAVGGDLFDFFYRDNKLFFCIGDVSGKGVPAALVMAVTQAEFRTIANNESSPAQIMKQLNNEMSRNNDTDMFVTLFVGVFNLATGHLHYCNAGHDAPFVITPDNPEIAALPVDANLPVGVMPDWQFSEQETILSPATTLFLYTDGLTEAENIHHDQFQEQRIIDVIRQADSHPRSLIATMTDAVHDFVGEAEQSDDLTMLAIRYQ